MSFPQLRSDVLNPLNTPPGAAAYSITCEPGEYVVTGATAALLAARVLSAGAGSYALTGADATLFKSINFIADAGTYSLTGADVGLRADRKIVAAEGNYSIAGANVELTYSPLVSNPDLSFNHDWQRGYPRAFHPTLRKPIQQRQPGQYLFVAESGTYVITGEEIDLRLIDVRLTFPERGVWPRPFAPGPWGHLTTLRKENILGSQAGTGFALAADAGTYQISGSAAALLYHRVFFAQAGAYSITGAAATLNVSMPADAGVYTITGADVTFRKNSLISAGSGVYTITGAAVTLFEGDAPENEGGVRSRRRRRHRN